VTLDEVDRPPEQFRQGIFCGSALSNRTQMTRLRIDKYVDVTVGAKVISQHGSKQRQPLDVMLPAYASQTTTIYDWFRSRGLLRLGQGRNHVAVARDHHRSFSRETIQHAEETASQLGYFDFPHALIVLYLDHFVQNSGVLGPDQGMLPV